MKYVKADKPISTTNKELGLITVEDVEVPQFDSLEEFVTTCNGEAPALEYINSCVERDAKDEGRVVIRTAAKGANIVDVIAKAAAKVREYLPLASNREPGKAKKAEAYDRVKAALESSENLSREQLLELLMAAK